MTRSRLIFIAVALALSCGKQAIQRHPQAQPEQPPAPSTQTTRPATEGRKGAPVPVRSVLAATVYFDFDRADIRPDQRATLEAAAATIRRDLPATVILEGHCDERGTIDYNLALGQRRADATRKYLIGLGVRPDLLWPVSSGEERPADPGHDKVAWAKNRRVEIGR